MVRPPAHQARPEFTRTEGRHQASEGVRPGLPYVSQSLRGDDVAPEPHDRAMGTLLCRQRLPDLPGRVRPRVSENTSRHSAQLRRDGHGLCGLRLALRGLLQRVRTSRAADPARAWQGRPARGSPDRGSILERARVDRLRKTGGQAHRRICEARRLGLMSSRAVLTYPERRGCPVLYQLFMR